MGHQYDITDKFEKLSISLEEKQSDAARSMFLLFKPKILNVINKIRESKKHPDNDAILDYITKTEASNGEQRLGKVSIPSIYLNCQTQEILLTTLSILHLLLILALWKFCKPYIPKL